MLVINRQYVTVVPALCHNHLLLLLGVTSSDRAVRPKVIQEVHVSNVRCIILCLPTPAGRLLMQSSFYSKSASRNQVKRLLA